MKTSEIDAVFIAVRCQRCEESFVTDTPPALAELVLGEIPARYQNRRAPAGWWIRPIHPHGRRGTIATWQTQTWSERLLAPMPTRHHHEAARLTGRDYIPLERRRETVEFGRCRQCGHAPRRRAGWLMDAGVRTIRAGSKDVFV
jgi:hypothetical protein